jgi:hypothetical protein
MAIPIDRVYQKVLTFANKEQRGYITPQEFNLFAHQAQMEIFEQYFYDVNQWQRQHGNSLGYSDMLENLQEKISLFEFTSVADNVTVLNRWGDVNLEADIPDLYRLGAVRVKYPDQKYYNEAEVVDNMKEFMLLAESKLTRRNNKRPVYLRYHNGYDRIKIYPYPVQDDGGDIDLNTNEINPDVNHVVVNSVTSAYQTWGVGKYMFFNESEMEELLGVEYVNNDVFDVKVVRQVNGQDVIIYEDKLEFFHSSSPSLRQQWGNNSNISSARKWPHLFDESISYYAPGNLNAKMGDWEIGDKVYITSNIYLGNMRNVKVDYVRTPKTPNWNYVVVNEKPLYNSTTSTNFELHQSEESELVYRILAYAGVAIEKPNLTQVAAGLEQAKVQQEKQ